MWKFFCKVWTWLEHLHTLSWIIFIIFGGGMITSIFRYITHYYSYLDLIVFFVSALLLSVPFFISRYTRKDKREDFSFVEDPGFYIHKKTQTKYCGKCFSQNKLNPLSFHPEKGLICRQCEEPYIAPYDYESAWKQASKEKATTTENWNKLGYSHFIRLCNVNDINNWDDNFKITDKGVYKDLKKDIGVYATKEELAELNYHHLNDLSKRCLDFPFTLEEFNQFIENYGLTGCVDQYYLKSLKTNRQSTLDKKSLIRDARSLAARIMKENNSDYYFEQEIMKSEAFLNLRPYFSDEFKSGLNRRSLLDYQLSSAISNVFNRPSTAARFIDEIDRLEKEWNLLV